MNEGIGLLKSRRSIRAFQPAAVPGEHIAEAIAAGQMASTSSAVQAYGALHITDPAKRAEIAELSGPQPKIVECGAFFVFFGDTRRHRLAAARDGNPYDARLEAFLVAAIDCSLFAEKAVIAFESMGYGICYIGGIRNDLPRLDRLLNLPEGVYPYYGLCVGVPAEDPTPRPRLPIDSVLFENGYPIDDAMLAKLKDYDDGYERYRVERGSDPARWSEIMGAKYQESRREVLAEYFAGKGARLD